MEVFFFITVPAIIAIAVFLISAYGRGILGLIVTPLLIGSSKPKKDKYVVRNLIFKQDERVVKIDMVIINPVGVHVVQILNMAGTIMGRENDLEWTVSYDHGLTKNKFFSPIKKISGQLVAFKQALELTPNVAVHPYLVFTNRSSIAIKTVHISVEYPIAFKQEFSERKTEHPLSSEEIKAIYDKLVNLKKNSPVTKKEYKAYAEQEELEYKKSKTKKA